MALALAASAPAQAQFGIALAPDQPTSSTPISATIGFATPSSPPTVLQRSVERIGSTIRISDCYRPGVFPAFGFYRYTQALGVLAAGTYRVEHWNTTCDSDEPPPQEAYTLQASVELTVAAGTPTQAHAVNALDRPIALVLLAMTMLLAAFRFAHSSRQRWERGR